MKTPTSICSSYTLKARMDVAHAEIWKKNKLIGAGFEYVRYSRKDEVAIYRKRK